MTCFVMCNYVRIEHRILRLTLKVKATATPDIDRCQFLELSRRLSTVFHNNSAQEPENSVSNH